MRSDWVSDETMTHIMAALMPENRLAIEMSLRYGMRIGDVLATKTEEVLRGAWTYTEEKTGKHRRIRLCESFQQRLLERSGRLYAFPHRLDWKKHRTRQAVYKDIKRAAKAFRVDAQVSPHTARKMYAVSAYKRYGSMKKVKELLNHSSEAVTMIYALADAITAKG